MSKSSILDSHSGSSANNADCAVVMHERQGVNNLKEDSASSVLAIREDNTTREALVKSAKSQKETSTAQNGSTKAGENGNVQRQSSSGVALPESNSAQEAALPRLSGASPPRRKKFEVVASTSSTSPSSTSQPVLVRTYSGSSGRAGSSKQSEMEKNRKSKAKNRPCDLPRLESFSFQDILASIDPEIQLSIDAIAEICGRSKLSLADEYSSHRPPHEELTSLQTDLATVLPAHLSPVQEYSRQNIDCDHKNSASLALIGSSNHKKNGIQSLPTAATSNVHSTSYTEPTTAKPSNVTNSLSEEQSSLLPHILAWIRRSSASITGPVETSLSTRDPSTVLHRVLSKGKAKT